MMLAYNSDTLFSFIQGEDRRMRVIIRTMSGKYSYTMKLFQIIGSDFKTRKYTEEFLPWEMNIKLF